MGPKMQVNLSGGCKNEFFYRKINFVTKSCDKFCKSDPYGFYHCLNVDLTADINIIHNSVHA